MRAALALQIQTVSSAKSSRARDSQTRTHDDGLAAFMRVRPRLFGIAYRMLGSAAGAEDIVQDVWVRWQEADRSLVRDAAAFLATTAKRLAINVMQSARSRRERYAGPSLPETVDTGADPERGAERGEGLEAGILLLLQKLSPAERAAYILREAFDYPYREIANVLRLEEANARQVVTRARHHVANGGSRPANWTDQRRLLEAFIAAARNGDVARLEVLVASDVVSTARHNHGIDTFATPRDVHSATVTFIGKRTRGTPGRPRPCSRARRLTEPGTQPGRSSGRFAARWPRSRPVDWPTSIR